MPGRLNHVVERTDDNQAARAGSPAEPEYTKNKVVNGEFKNSIVDNMNSAPDNWYVWAGEGGVVGNYEIIDGEFKIDVLSLGNQSWAVQFAQYLDLDGGDYTLSFDARADADRDIIAMVQEDGGAWTVYGEINAGLDTEMQEYSFDVVLAAADVPKLVFSLGSTENGKETAVYIDNVKLQKIK